MTFTAGNLFPSYSCIDVTRVKPPPGFEPRSPGPLHERWTTYQLNYPSPLRTDLSDVPHVGHDISLVMSKNIGSLPPATNLKHA